MNTEISDFKLGALVLPAVDGMLAELGFDVKQLGPLALGVITEEGSRRSHVHFPELKTSLWLEHSELKDVVDEMKTNPSFQVIEKYLIQKPEEMLMPVLMSYLIGKLNTTHILGVDHGTLEDVWEEAKAKLKEYFSGNLSTNVFRLSLGLEELNPKTWDEIQKLLGSRLLVQRFLPSGMHKFELSLYLKR